MAQLRRVLLIDDDLGTLETFQAALQRIPCAVTTAATGQRGLYLSTTGRYDVVVVDLRLPDIPGLEILNKMRQAQVSTPTIVMTGFASIATAVAAIRCG